MKDPKPTKKELATQTRELEEQVTRLKNRLNGQVFKKTKHGYRLDQLSEGAHQLSGRIGELEQQLARLSEAQDELAKQWQQLKKSTVSAKGEPEEGGGKKRLKEQLRKLKFKFTGLSLMQEQMSSTLRELQKTVGGVENVRDDLKLETGELQAQVRNLEESSSRLSVDQSSQEARTRELEGLLAELTLKQQQDRPAAADAALAENLRQQLDAATAPLKEQLQQLSQSTSDEGRRHEEVDRQLQALGNRIGGLGELQNAFERAGNVRDDLKLETGELRAQVRNLEESSSRLAVNQSTQEARTRELEGLLAELTLKQQNLAAADATLAESLRQQLDAAIAPLREQLQQLSQSASDEGGRLKEVDRRLQDLGNRIGDLGGRFHHLSEDVANQREQREHLERELDPRLQQLEARNTDIDDLESQLGAALKKETDALWRALEEKDRDVETLREQLAALSDSEQSPEIDQKLSGVAAEVSRLSEAEDFLQESFRGLGGLELNLTSRLDDLQRQLQTHIERSREYEEAIQRLSAELGDISGNLQQLEQADLRQQQRVEALDQKQALLTQQIENAESRHAEVDGQLDRIEESFTAERERLSQLEENLSRAGVETETQTAELEQGRLLQQELQSRLDDLNEDFASHSEQNASLIARLDAQELQHQALADKVGAQTAEQQALKEKVEAQAMLQQVLSDKVDEHSEQQSALIKERESVRETLSALEQRGQQNATQSTGVERELRAFRQQFEAEKGSSEKQVQSVQAVATSFDTLDAKVEAQQPRMEAIESVGKSNRIGLFVLFFLGLLGALALWWSNMGRVAEIEQRITQEPTSPDQRYITREYLADKLQALESVLTGNSERIEKVAAALPSQNLVEHQTELEQHLARLEAKLNSGTTGTADSGASSDAPDKPLPPEVQRIQLELERINTALAQLSKQSAAGTGDAGLSVLEERLSKTAEQLGTRLSQLEAERLDAGSSRIAAIERAAKETSEQLGARIDQLNSQQESIARIERNLSDTGKALGARLDKLETDSADTGEMLRQLQNQLLASGVSRKTSVQAATASEKSDPAIWQAAADTGRYAIQLAGSRNKSALIAFTSGYSLPADTAYFRTVYAGRDWYILLLGPYSSFSNASNVLENLPSALNRYDPWIRKIPADAELIAR